MVLVCQAVSALSNTAARAERLHRACVPASVLWLMASHPSYRGSLKMQKLGLAAVLAVWCCPKVRQALLLREAHEEAVARSVGMLREALDRTAASDALARSGPSRHSAHGGLNANLLGWGAGERRFVAEMLEQVAAQRSDVDCMMS